MKLELIKKEKYFDIYFVGMEKALKNSQIVMFNNDIIKINDELIFIKENLSRTTKLIYSTLFIGSDFIELDEQSFNEMQQLILNKKENKEYIVIDYGRKPTAQVLINLQAIKNNMVSFKSNEKTLIANNIIFTVDSMEFLGDSLFAGKQNSFKVDPEVFTFIKKYLTLDTIEFNENKKGVF